MNDCINDLHLILQKFQKIREACKVTMMLTKRMRKEEEEAVLEERPL